MSKFRIFLNVFIFLSFLFFTNSLFAQLLTEEFSYTAGQTLTSNGWTAYSASTTNPVLVTSGSLSYTNYPSSGTGNSTQVIGTSSSSEDVQKFFTSQNSGSIYVSFLVNFSTATSAANGDYFFGLQSSSSTTFKGRVYIKESGPNIAFGLSKAGTTPTLTSFSYSLSTTYLLVLKYTFNSSSSDDVINLFVNPDLSGTEPLPTLTNIDAASDLTNVGAIALRQGTAAYNVTIDGIRVATSWSQAPLPVELISFSAIQKDNSIVLNWQTVTEINNYGFDVERKSPFAPLSSWVKIGFVAGHGNTNTPQDYTFEDKNPVGGTTFYYRLKQIDVDGKFEYSDILQIDLDVPNKAKLMQNSPNPFNPSTSIKFFIPFQSDVTIKIYDLLGREVATLINKQMNKGFYIVFWNGKDKYGNTVSSSVYLYRLTAGNFAETKKMTLLK